MRYQVTVTLDSHKDNKDAVSVSVLNTLEKNWSSMSVLFVESKRVADPNNDEFECVVCDSINDIEDSIKTEQGLVCPSCAEEAGL